MTIFDEMDKLTIPSLTKEPTTLKELRIMTNEPTTEYIINFLDRCDTFIHLEDGTEVLSLATDRLEQLQKENDSLKAKSEPTLLSTIERGVLESYSKEELIDILMVVGPKWKDLQAKLDRVVMHLRHVIEDIEATDHEAHDWSQQVVVRDAKQALAELEEDQS